MARSGLCAELGSLRNSFTLVTSDPDPIAIGAFTFDAAFISGVEDVSVRV